MNPTQENTQFFEVLETLIENGPEQFRQVLRILLNEAMKIERNQFLHAGPNERNEDRRGYANGYKPKTLKTRIGPVICRNVYSLLRRTSKHQKVIEKLNQLLTIVDILQMDREIVIETMNSKFKDFEDALQNYSAVSS